ncbi:MAG: MobC family plasmid mobilization relaxosome protein [Clostridia bacterium]
MREKVARFEMKLSYDEEEKLKRDSLKANLTKSEYVRRLIMNCKLREKPDDRFYEVMTQLTKIGNNLNQIAHVANYSKNINKDYYDNEANKWNEFMNKIKKEYL